MLLVMTILSKKKKTVVGAHHLIYNIITKGCKLFLKQQQLIFENHQ